MESTCLTANKPVTSATGEVGLRPRLWHCTPRKAWQRIFQGLHPPEADNTDASHAGQGHRLSVAHMCRVYDALGATCSSQKW